MREERERHFLQRFGVHNIPGANKAAKRKARLKGQENLANDPNERINAYMERLGHIFLNPDETTRKRNIELLRPDLYEAFIIKEEDFPESYFVYQKRLIKEERGLGEVEFTPEQKQAEVNKVIVDQQNSLDSWIDYLTEDSPYPTDIRYFVIQGVLKLGKFDTEKYSFARRMSNSTTISPFPEIDREALAKVMGALNVEYKGAEKREGHSGKLEELVKKGANFGKLYGKAMRELDESFVGGKNWEETEGEWRKFDQGSDPKLMQRTLENKRSNLCIGAGDSHAQAYLEAGDMYLYYSKDRDGNYTVPRAAISVQENVVWEVRGTFNKNEDLDPYIIDIVNEQLSTLPSGDKYNKKVADMKRLTLIDNKVKGDQGLTKEELNFLYELDSKIEGFGFNDDPRIKEILDQRNIKTDLVIVYECSLDQIVDFSSQITEDTKVYLGSLNSKDVDILNNRENPLLVYGHTDFSGCASLVSIPKNTTFNGHTDFSGCASLVSIPKNTTFNGHAYFDGCTSLVSISKNTTFNGFVDFSGCASLVSIPQNTTFNGRVYFSRCTSLVSIPRNTTFNKYANFRDCPSLASISQNIIFNGNADFRDCPLSNKLIEQLVRMKKEGKIKGKLLL